MADQDDLLGHDVTDPSQDQGHEHDDENHRPDPTRARVPETGPLERAHRRTEQEAQEQGHRDGNENGLRPVERGDDRDGEGADQIRPELSEERASLPGGLTLALWQCQWADSVVARSHRRV